MNAKEKYLPILLFSCVALGVMIGGMINFPNRKFSSQNQHKAKLNQLIDFINQEYVDEVDSDSIVNLTVNSILQKLDPHSVYLPPVEQSSESEMMRGDFVGIGINFYMYNDTVAVINTVPNGPAAQAGIRAGDRILYSEKVPLFGRKMPSDSLFRYFKGEEGSTVNLTVYRKSTRQKLTLPVVRDVIPIKSVDVGLLLQPDVGYIKINRFAETTYDEFHTYLDQLRKKGAKEIIIDVRENSGGYLEKAVEIADEFLQQGELIVFTKNKRGKVQKTFATADGIFENGKVKVLIDENSASASEILAGAIQDNDRGLILGRRSFGKGLVQREMDFEDGSAVRLTTARYYTPTGRSIQKPYKKGDTDAYMHDFEKRFETGEWYKKDKIKLPDSLKFKTKKGRIVYGGGGIVPDIFIPLEVQKGAENILFILNSGLLGHFVFEQIDYHRARYLQYNAASWQKVNVAPLVLSFERYLKDNGLEVTLQNNNGLVEKYLRAEFARQLFNEEIYYRLLLKDDPMIIEALRR